MNADVLSRAPVMVIKTDLLHHQLGDKKLSDIFSKIEEGEGIGKFKTENGILLREWKGKAPHRPGEAKWVPVIPASLRYEVMKACHDDPTAGHLGFRRTYKKIHDRFWWKGMKKDVKHWVDSCQDCATRKSPNNLRADHMEPIPVGTAWGTIGMDFIGPLPHTKRGNQYILVFTEYLTKWVEAFPTTNCKAETVAKFFVEDVVARYEAPMKIISDRGTHFHNKLILETCRLLGISQSLTTAYHPQTDGLTERFNQTLVDMLSKYIGDNSKDWDELIPYVLFGYRTAVQESTRETPFYLMFGRDPVLPIDVALR
jgi:hypothetical protein